MSIKITVTNFSSIEWNRYKWKHHEGTDVTSLESTPDEILMARSGHTVAEFSQFSLESITQVPIWMTLGYENGDNDKFAIILSRHFQEFSIGKGVTWEIYRNGEWTDLDESTKIQEWNFGKYTVRATPNLKHQDGSVDIVIKDAHK